MSTEVPPFAESGEPMMDPNPETTAAIARIDRELSKTFQGIARLNDDIAMGRILCMVCAQPGIHTHFTAPGQEGPND